MELGRIRIEDITRSHGMLVPYLFPQARDIRTAPALYGAFAEEKPDRMLGMALLSSPIGTEDPAYRFGLHVFEEYRNRGIGTQLLKHLVEMAGALHAPALRNMQSARSQAAQNLMQRFGFASRRQTIGHEFSIERAFEIFDAQFQLLRSAGRIPEGVVTASYVENKEEHPLSALCKREFGALTYGHLEALGEFPAPDKDYSFSRSFWLDGRLLGAWAVALKAGRATFDPLLIAPGKRNTWVFTCVIQSVLRELVGHGVRLGYAQVHQDNLKIMSIMRRVSATTVDVETLYELSLGRDVSLPGALA